jgi:hypothetical protein
VHLLQSDGGRDLHHSEKEDQNAFILRIASLASYPWEDEGTGREQRFAFARKHGKEYQVCTSLQMGFGYSAMAYG